MRMGWGSEPGDCSFDPPPRFATLERRMSGLALEAWAASGGTPVSGFTDHSMIIGDIGGAARIDSIGALVAESFHLAIGMALIGRPGLAAEITAACDLIALRSLPVPFEASLAAPGRALVLARGIALPLANGRDPAERVQVIVNWREVLNRAATARLRREIGAALRISMPKVAISDPFSPKSAA